MGANRRCIQTEIVHRCCQPINDGNNKLLMPKIKANLYNPLLNVKNLQSYYLSIYI